MSNRNSRRYPLRLFCLASSQETENMSGFKDLLIKSEAAQRARISPRLLDREIADGRRPTITRIGGKVLIREDHLAEWIDSLSVPPTRVA